MRQIQSNGFNESVQSLSVLMPPVIDQLLTDEEGDKFDTRMCLYKFIEIYIKSIILFSSSQSRKFY
jgi:hypothetical protein